GASPGLEAAVEGGDVGGPERGAGDRGERGAAAPGAVQDGALGRVELGAVVRAVGVRVELEHAPGCVHRALDHAVLLQLGGLAQVDDDRAVGGFAGDLVRGEVLDLGLRSGDELDDGVRHGSSVCV